MEASRRYTEPLVTEFGEYYEEIAKTVSDYSSPAEPSLQNDIVGVSMHKELDMNF